MAKVKKKPLPVFPEGFLIPPKIDLTNTPETVLTVNDVKLQVLSPFLFGGIVDEYNKLTVKPKPSIVDFILDLGLAKPVPETKVEKRQTKRVKELD